jgi:hypothetical protein
MSANTETRIAELEAQVQSLWKAVETLFVFHGRKPPNRPQRPTPKVIPKALAADVQRARRLGVDSFCIAHWRRLLEMMMK